MKPVASDSDNPSSKKIDCDRCRLILVIEGATVTPDILHACLSQGDVASIICRGPFEALSDATGVLSALVEVAHEHDVPLIVENDTRVLGRSGADGLIVTNGVQSLKDAIARFSPKKIVGYGNVKTRHDAMTAGELLPDFLFVGKLGGDIRAEPHPKSLAITEWCVEVMDLPVVMMGGTAIASAVAAAETGAEFVALGRAVFDAEESPSVAVAAVNELLDERAPDIIHDDELT